MNAKPAMPGEGREGPPPSTGRDSEPLTRDAERPTRTAERVAEAIERRHATDAE
ncbi:ArsR family transcriptional regulator, partial [Geobacillus sp. MMMUD3]|nr:ArsR family transcriptional regulator [Geobacillus sp. MMMUD3]